MTTSYVAGTVSVSAGGRTVTGVGTSWILANVAPGFFGLQGEIGPVVPVERVVSDTELLLYVDWPGETVSGASYWLSYDTRDGQQSVNNAIRLSEYIARLDSDSLSAIAALSPEANMLIMYTGSNTAVLVPMSQLGGLFDRQVPTIADRAQFDDRPQGFRVLVSDTGDGISALYTKDSAVSGDWSEPAFITGPKGDQGPSGGFTSITAGTTTTLPSGSDATVTPVEVSPGEIRLDFGLPRGEDGEGTGDVKGPSSSVAGRVVVFSGSDGKEISDSGVTLGSSASLDVGTTDGTVAAGNDSRFLTVGTTAGTVAAGDDPRFSQSSGGQNDAIFGLEIADLKGSRLGLKQGVMDAFDDETGVETKTNATYDASNDWYTPAPITGSTLSSVTFDTDVSISAQRKYRHRIAAAGISASASYIRVQLTGPQAGTSKTVTNVFFGRAASGGDAWDMSASSPAPVRLTFGGLNSVTPPVGGSVWSDWVPFALDNSFAHVVAIDLSAATGSLRYASSTPANYSSFYKDGTTDEAGTPDVTGYINAVVAVFSALAGKNTQGDYADMTLRSVNYPAQSQPSKARIAVQLVGTESITINTDLIVRASRDGGANWATGALSLSQNLIGPRVFEDNGIDLSSLPGGTSMKWEVRTANGKNISVSGLSFQWA